MIRELDSVALKHDIAAHGLEQGDIGAVVHCYDDTAYEVEFVTADGKTIALLTLNHEDIQPIRGKVVLHAREMEQIAV